MIAVSEKPLATTAKELDELLAALRTTTGRYFAGFHKRYSELNDICCHYLRRDSIGGPISYHCIVHEVPLPRRHWYNWPNSKTRVVSNGCHWMDHWMFLNEFAPITRHTATRMKCGDIVVTAEAANDASFSMTLTDQGSSRIGVQDTVELRSGDVTVRVMNGASLIAEDSRRVLKRKRVNRTGSYARMYREIAAKIGSGASGDSRESIERSTRFMLEVEDSLSR
jgi:predicted dehydrogenase